MGTESQTNHANEAAATDPSLDVLFEVLAEPHRRFALSYLHDRSTPIAIADLIMEIAAHHHEVAKDEVPGDVVKRQTVAFRHRHLPKLVDANLVAIDADRNTVVATETLQSVDDFLTIGTEKAGTESI